MTVKAIKLSPVMERVLRALADGSSGADLCKSGTWAALVTRGLVEATPGRGSLHFMHQLTDAGYDWLEAKERKVDAYFVADSVVHNAVDITHAVRLTLRALVQRGTRPREAAAMLRLLDKERPVRPVTYTAPDGTKWALLHNGGFPVEAAQWVTPGEQRPFVLTLTPRVEASRVTGRPIAIHVNTPGSPDTKRMRTEELNPDWKWERISPN